jgi:hypothetical protein
MKSSTETLIEAMRILARDIESGDGVANAAIAEAAERLQELHAESQAKSANIDKLIERNRHLYDELRGMRAKTYAESNTEKADWWYCSDGDISSDSPDGVAQDCDLDLGGIMQVFGAKEVDVKYVAHLAVDYDDEGDLNDSEYVDFPTREEAEKAVAAMPKPERKSA